MVKSADPTSQALWLKITLNFVWRNKREDQEINLKKGAKNSIKKLHNFYL